MRVSTKIVSDIVSGRVLLRESYEYEGPLELFCGATDAQKQAQAQEAQLASTETEFYKSMQADFATIFGQNQNILSSLTKAFEPIVAAGPNQEGFSQPEVTAMRTGASDATTIGAQNAQIAAAAKAATGGAASQIPSGAQDQISAMINESAANENAREQGLITQEDYATGRQNFFNASSELGSAVGATENPTSGFAGATSGAGNAANAGNQAAMEGATQIQQANDAWMGPVFGMIGSIGGAALAKKP